MTICTMCRKWKHSKQPSKENFPLSIPADRATGKREDLLAMATDKREDLLTRLLAAIAQTTTSSRITDSKGIASPDMLSSILMESSMCS